MFTTRSLELAAFKEYITCSLCKGYLVDCVKIDECLHTFCKSCLVNWLNRNANCPVCDLEVNRLKPWLNLRIDTTLQAIVNRIVPNLQQEEMRRRRRFYSRKPKLSKYADVSDVGSPTVEDELFCFSLRPSMSSPVHNTIESEEDCSAGFEELFVQALSSIPISVLAKFVRLKVAASSNAQVQILAETESGDQIAVPEELCLADVTQTLCWKGEEPFHLSFFVQQQNQRGQDAADPSLSTADDNTSECDGNNTISRHTSEQSSEPSQRTTTTMSDDARVAAASTPVFPAACCPSPDGQRQLDNTDRMIYYCLSLPGRADGRQVAAPPGGVPTQPPFVPIVVNGNCVENNYHYERQRFAGTRPAAAPPQTMTTTAVRHRPAAVAATARGYFPLVKLCSPMKKYPTIRPKTASCGMEPSRPARRRLLVIRPGRLTRIKSVVRVRIRRQRKLFELLSHRITKFELQKGCGAAMDSWTPVDEICSSVVEALVARVARTVR